MLNALFFAHELLLLLLICTYNLQDSIDLLPPNHYTMQAHMPLDQSPHSYNIIAAEGSNDNSVLVSQLHIHDCVPSQYPLHLHSLADAAQPSCAENAPACITLPRPPHTAELDLSFLACAPAVPMSAEDISFFSSLLPADLDEACQDWSLPQAEDLAIQEDQLGDYLLLAQDTAVINPDNYHEVHDKDGIHGLIHGHQHGIHHLVHGKYHGPSHEEPAVSDCVAGSGSTFTTLSAPSTSCLTSSNQLMESASVKCMDAPPKPKRRALKKQRSVKDLKQTELSDLSDSMEEDVEKETLCADGKSQASKNLVCERKRRMKLNERLYSLRAIVPKISKMDKVSIVGDAIKYVQDLQKRVKAMHEEILTLQAVEIEDGLSSCAFDSGINDALSSSVPEDLPRYKITELNVSGIEQKMHNLHIHCRKSPGVMLQLTKALEALNFEIVSANLSTVNDYVVNTIVVKMNGSDVREANGVKEMMEQMFPEFGLDM